MYTFLYPYSKYKRAYLSFHVPQVKSLINGARQVAKFHIKKQYKDALLLEFCEEFDRYDRRKQKIGIEKEKSLETVVLSCKSIRG